MSSTQTISIVIITKNAERTLSACLESVKWASEVIVVDSGSDDSTEEIAKEFGAKFHSVSWLGFGPQKNVAIDLATSHWALSLDADEVVTPSLATEIQDIIRQPHTEKVYEILRISKYCGKEMRHSGWDKDYVARLFHRGSAVFSNSLVHERLLFEGDASKLINHLEHDSFESLEEVLEKMNRYSTLGAKELAIQNKKSSVFKAVTHGLAAFFKTYFIKAGFLDGAEGFMLAISNAEGAYYKYLKLYLSQK